MKTYLVACVILVPFSLAVAQDDAAKKELAKLDGTWQVVTFEEGGEKPSPEFWRTISFTFKNKQMEFKGDAALTEKASRIGVTVDPSTTPRVIDFKIEAGSSKGTTLEGIYEINGDELKICLRSDGAKQRPSEFATGADAQVVLFVLKRK